MSDPAPDYTEEIERVRAAMKERFPHRTEWVDDWMQYPNSNYGMSPIEVIESGRADWIWNTIGLLQMGAFS